MDVWAMVWEYPNESENNFTLWSNELDALEKACSEIEDKITDQWDMDDETQSEYAGEIARFHEQGKRREAMEKWNDYQSNYNDDYAEYYSVLKKTVLSDTGDVVSPTPGAQYKATTSGATCRGPCKQFNDYAYADRPDGTHMCYQCSTFNHVFGVTKS